MISTVMKKVSVASTAAFVVGILGIGQAKAVTIGPDSYGYRATDEIPFTFQDISRTGTRVLAGGDDATSSASLGFGFKFYGTQYNSVSFSTNGLLSFRGSNSDFTNTNLNTQFPFPNLPSIAVLWDDWQFFSAGTDAVYYQTMGTSGSRRFITQWNLAEGYPDSPSPVTFQSVLFEGSNDILLSYQDVNSGDFRSFGGSATVGIRNVNSNFNRQNLQWSFNTPVIRNGQSIRISVPEPGSMLGLLALGAFGVPSLMKRKQQQKSIAKA